MISSNRVEIFPMLSDNMPRLSGQGNFPQRPRVST